MKKKALFLGLVLLMVNASAAFAQVSAKDITVKAEAKKDLVNKYTQVTMQAPKKNTAHVIATVTLEYENGRKEYWTTSLIGSKSATERAGDGVKKAIVTAVVNAPVITAPKGYSVEFSGSNATSYTNVDIKNDTKDHAGLKVVVELQNGKKEEFNIGVASKRTNTGVDAIKVRTDSSKMKSVKVTVNGTVSGKETFRPGNSVLGVRG
jgi:uncharacterized protein Veg